MIGVEPRARGVETQAGVKSNHPDFRGPEAKGLTGVGRMTDDEWNAFDGWCGHQHVPENTHWDPGKLDIDSMFAPMVITRLEAGDPIVVLAGVHIGCMELYGTERLDAFLTEHAALAPSSLARAVAEDARAFAGGDLTDDLAVVVIRRTA